MAQSKRKLPVGDAIGHFLTLSVFKLTTKTNLPHIDRQIESLRDALNTLQIEIDFSCLEDLDGDGQVTSGDVAFMLLDFGPCEGCSSDLDGSGDVNNGDVALLLLSYGPCP